MGAFARHGKEWGKSKVAVKKGANIAVSRGDNEPWLKSGEKTQQNNSS